MNQAIDNAVIQTMFERGLISVSMQEKMHGYESLGEALNELIHSGSIAEREFAEVISESENLRLISAKDYPKKALANTTEIADFLHRHEIIPIQHSPDEIVLAVCNPFDQFATKVLEAKFDKRIKLVIGTRSDLLFALNQLYTDSNEEPTQANNEDSVDSPVVREINKLLTRAVAANASDIHFEQSPTGVRVRFRLIGLLQDVYQFGSRDSDQVIARLKLLAQLDVTEKRLAQDGRFSFVADGKQIDLRASTLPLNEGESVVFRLLGAQHAHSNFQSLGFSKSTAGEIEKLLASQNGLVLVTGPTGSGKTTTLYTMLNQLNKHDRKIISIEEPVELKLAGINQVDVDATHGISFASALRSVLRQDPDIIMLGEIRDAETAQLAIQAALTGHLVLSTLHTQDAASAATRLLDLGIEPFLLATTLRGVIAQRLIRLRCQACDQSTQQDCETCFGSGFSKRTTAAELLVLNQTDASPNWKSDNIEAELRERLFEKTTLRQNALELSDSNQTDEREIIRAIGLE